MVITVAGDEMGSATTDTVFTGGLLQGLDDPGVVGETEIVVAAKVQAGLSIDIHFHTLGRLH